MTKRKGLTLRSRSINNEVSPETIHENCKGNQDKIKKTKGQLILQKSPDTVRVIRDTFSMPHDDYALIADIKNKCMLLEIEMNKGEIIRAGLHSLNIMSPQELKKIVITVEKVKTGRPAKQHDKIELI